MKIKGKKQQSNSKFRNKQWFLVFIAGILLISGLIFYSDSFNCSFQFDDANLITRNEKIINLGNYFKTSHWSDVNIRPLSYFSFALNYSIHEQDVWGYHLINILIHILTSFLVFLLARLIFQIVIGRDRINEKASNRNALIISLLFLLHPLQTMAVTYIVQRMTCMAAMFYILSVFLYGKGRLDYISGERSGRGILLIFCSILAGILAVMSKQIAVTFPVSLLLFELYFIRNKKGHVFKKYLIPGFFLLLAGVIFITVAGLLPRETDQFTRSEYLVTQFRVFIRYVQLLFIPIGQNVDYSMPISRSILGFQEIIGLLLFLGLIFLSVLLFKKNRIISFGIIWFFVTISVESSLIPIKDVIMEHRLYLPMFGFGLVLVETVYSVCKTNRVRYCNSGFIIILIILGILTYQRNKVWKTDYTLWKDCLEKTPDNKRAMTNFGYALVKQKKYKDGIKYYTKALEQDSLLIDAYFNRGIALFDIKKYDYAIKDLSKVIEHRRNSEVPYFFRGVSYAHVGKYPEAIRDLTKAIKLNPNIAESYKNRGIVYESTHNYMLALEDYNKSLDLDPSNKKLLINRSKANYMVRRFQDALKDVREAEKIGIKVDYNYIKMLELKIKNREDTIRPVYKIRKE